jgi:soluble lytic murein transglycosylase-like protein
MENRTRRRWRWYGPMIYAWFISSFSMFLFIPIHPWGGTINFATGEIDGLDARRSHRTANIYAALKANEVRLNDATVRKLARSIQEESEKHSLDPMLVLAVIKVESQFDHRAVSPNGARGLMQIQPVAANVVLEEADVLNGKAAIKIDDPIINVKIGTAYLKHLKEMFGDIKLTLTAYNCGPTRLRQKLAAKEAVPLAYAQKVFSAQRLLKKQWRSGNSFLASPEAQVLETS